MNLDTIEARDLGSKASRVGEAFDRICYIGVRSCGRHWVFAFAVIESHLITLRLNRRRCDGASDETVTLVEGAGVHDLRNDLGVCAVDALYKCLPGLCLYFIADARLEDIALRVLMVGVETLSDQQAEVTLSEAVIVVSHLLGRTAIFSCANAGHRRDCEAVLDLEGADLARCIQ
ncbi:hypothetical protein D3C79_649360 [compost metagenome]